MKFHEIKVYWGESNRASPINEDEWRNLKPHIVLINTFVVPWHSFMPIKVHEIPVLPAYYHRDGWL